MYSMYFVNDTNIIIILLIILIILLVINFIYDLYDFKVFAKKYYYLDINIFSFTIYLIKDKLKKFMKK